jgi:hypothetical protein
MPIPMFNWPLLRAVALLKRIAISLEQLVAIERQRTPAPRPIRKAEISVASVADWNKKWEEEHPVYDTGEEGEP